MRKFHVAALGLAAGVAVAFAATSANADGRRSIKDEAGPAPFSWAGIYVGLHAGAGWSEVDWNGPAAFFGVTNFSSEANGALFGGQAGGVPRAAHP